MLAGRGNLARGEAGGPAGFFTADYAFGGPFAFDFGGSEIGVGYGGLRR